MVPEAGIEPARPFYGKRRILSPMCLPISPLGHFSTHRCIDLQMVAIFCSGGGKRNRTALNGFAGRCITSLLSRREVEIVSDICISGISSQSQQKRKPVMLPLLKNWSGKRVSNSRPQPWQGCALPTELFPRTFNLICCTNFSRPAIQYY